MRWQITTRFDPAAAALADRHYTRQTVGSDQFMPSGRALVLLTPELDAVWGTSWQVSGDGILYAVHDWPEAWNCSIFRNESPHLSSELILEAVAATVYVWGDPPKQGFVTFVDPEKTRRKRDPGRCFRKAGFDPAGETTSGKVALVLPVERFPAPQPPVAASLALFDGYRTPFVARARRTAIGGQIDSLERAEPFRDVPGRDRSREPQGPAR